MADLMIKQGRALDWWVSTARSFTWQRRRWPRADCGAMLQQNIMIFALEMMIFVFKMTIFG